jgi:hypothetical protein
MRTNHMKAKRALAAERKLLEKLQEDHGYMFADLRTGMVNDSDRSTMLFSRNRKTGKHTLTLSRVLRVMAPDGSHLANMVVAAKRTAKRTAPATRKKGK